MYFITYAYYKTVVKVTNAITTNNVNTILILPNIYSN
jgi:hypothetical protein